MPTIPQNDVSAQQQPVAAMMPQNGVGIQPSIDPRRIRNEIDAVKDAGIRTDEHINDLRKRVEESRRRILGEFFAMLRDVGVDPSDPQSVAEFVTRLREGDPDMAMMFEAAFNQLLPSDREMMEAGNAPPEAYTERYDRLKSMLPGPEQTQEPVPGGGEMSPWELE